MEIMEQKPILDLSGYYFKDSYINEIKIFKRKTKLLKYLKWMQVKFYNSFNNIFRKTKNFKKIDIIMRLRQNYLKL